MKIMTRDELSVEIEREVRCEAEKQGYRWDEIEALVQSELVQFDYDADAGLYDDVLYGILY